LDLNKYKIMLKRKKAAPYQIKRSAVKKTQKKKRGIDSTRNKIPNVVTNFGLRLSINKIKTTRNTIS